MANDPPFATLNHYAGDSGIPSESVSLRIGISSEIVQPDLEVAIKAAIKEHDIRPEDQKRLIAVRHR